MSLAMESLVTYYWEEEHRSIYEWLPAMRPASRAPKRPGCLLHGETWKEDFQLLVDCLGDAVLTSDYISAAMEHDVCSCAKKKTRSKRNADITNSDARLNAGKTYFGRSVCLSPLFI